LPRWRGYAVLDSLCNALLLFFRSLTVAPRGGHRKKFACSASIVKDEGGNSQIVLQGDDADGVVQFIATNYKIAETQINFVDDGKMKKKAAGPKPPGGGRGAMKKRTFKLE